MENFTDVSDLELLKMSLNRGIIDIEKLRDDYNMYERKKLLEMHSFEKWHGKNGRWYTYLPDEEKGRRLVARKTEKELDDIIADYYKEKVSNPTVETVFNEWLDEKLEYNEIQKQSYDKYKNEFRRFFENDFFPLAKYKIKSVDEDTLERFIKTCIVKLELTKKSYSNMRILINGIFKYAKRHKYTDISITNFMGDLALSARSFKKVVKEKSSQVFMENEIPLVMNYLQEHSDVYNQAIQVAFLAGVRVGELAALKYGDFQKKPIGETGETRYTLSIRRTEIKCKNENENWMLDVREMPKTDAGIRDIIVTKEVADIIEAVHEQHPDSEYLFVNKSGKRIRGNTFNKRLSSVCEKLGIPHRTMHKIRKTYGTTLLDGDVDDALIAEMMGHKDINTTRQYYYFSNKDEAHQVEQMTRALSNI